MPETEMARRSGKSAAALRRRPVRVRPSMAGSMKGSKGREWRVLLPSGVAPVNLLVG